MRPLTTYRTVRRLLAKQLVKDKKAKSFVDAWEQLKYKIPYRTGYWKDTSKYHPHQGRKEMWKRIHA